MNADIAALAAAGKMIPNAPVMASRSITINVSTDRVWQILTDVKDWPRWHPYLKNAELNGDFAAGAALSYGRPPKHRLTVARVSANELVMLYGSLSIYTAVTRRAIQN